MDRARHDRQIRLAEVGVEGQARLSRARATVHGAGVGARVEARYLAGAGLGRLEVNDASLVREVRDVDPRASVVVSGEASASVRPDPGWAAWLDPAAREVALGAYRALETLHAALGGDADDGDAGEGGS